MRPRRSRDPSSDKPRERFAQALVLRGCYVMELEVPSRMLSFRHAFHLRVEHVGRAGHLPCPRLSSTIFCPSIACIHGPRYVIARIHAVRASNGITGRVHDQLIATPRASLLAAELRLKYSKRLYGTVFARAQEACRAATAASRPSPGGRYLSTSPPARSRLGTSTYDDHSTLQRMRSESTYTHGLDLEAIRGGDVLSRMDAIPGRVRPDGQAHFRRTAGYVRRGTHPRN